MATTSRSSSSERTGAGAMTMTSTLKKAHCLADGQLTPPSSPDETSKPHARTGPRLQLSKLLRRPKAGKSNNIIHISHPTEIRTLQMPACVSEMELPLPILYPDSPVNSDRSGSTEVSPTSAPELRRISASYQDLRSAAALQTSPKLSHNTTPLLPSPITCDTKDPGGSYFQFRNPRIEKTVCEYKSYDDFRILSCYYDESNTASLQDIQQSLEDVQHDPPSTPPIVGDDDYASSTETEDMPITPRDQVRRPTVCSEEGDWLASTRSHTERMRRFKARCYQVVQHPMSSRKTQDNEDQIMLATVLVGPGKPKLVQISRPSSKSSSLRPGSTSPNKPHTPGSTPVEVSAFSPFDTPAPTKAYASYSQKTLPVSDINYSSASLIPAPLTLASRSMSLNTTATSSTAFSATHRHIDSLADPFAGRQSGPSNEAHPARSSSLRPCYTLQPHDCRTPSPIPSPSTIPLRHLHNRRLERALNAVTQAINSFPDGILRLDSPPILELRSPHVSDQTYLSILQKVFPSARQLLLSALAAWIVVDLYFARIIAESGRMPTSSLKRVDNINSWDHITMLAARSNDSLHRIPTKARDLLGIGRPDMSAERCKEAALVKRAVIVSHSVGVISQRLVEALRGTWDEDVWRSLRCLVEVVEAGGGGGGSDRSGMWV